MFAALALLCFFIVLIGWSHIGVIDLTTLGLCFLAAHLWLSWGWSTTPWRRG